MKQVVVSTAGKNDFKILNKRVIQSKYLVLDACTVYYSGPNLRTSLLK